MNLDVWSIYMFYQGTLIQGGMIGEPHFMYEAKIYFCQNNIKDNYLTSCNQNGTYKMRFDKRRWIIKAHLPLKVVINRCLKLDQKGNLTFMACSL